MDSLLSTMKYKIGMLFYTFLPTNSLVFISDIMKENVIFESGRHSLWVASVSKKSLPNVYTFITDVFCKEEQ